MFNFDYITKEDIKEHNPNKPKIPDHPYRILIIGASGSEKTNALPNITIMNRMLIKVFYMQKVHLKKISIVN